MAEEWRQRVADSFARQGLLVGLSSELVSVEKGLVEIALPYDERVSQQHDFFHAGALATIADSAMGYSALTLMPDGSDVLSVEFKVSMLRPAVGERAVARGEVVRSGKTLSFCTANVYVEREGESKLCVTATGTMFRVAPRQED